LDEGTIQYLIELRKRLLQCVFVVGVVLCVFAFYANSIYHLLALPLLKGLPAGGGLIATSVPAPFLVPFKSAFFAAIYVTVPYWLYHVWMFVAPALYRRERRLVWPLLLSSSLLFYVGTLFAYFAVLPLVFHFFIQVAPVGVEVKPDIGKYFDFIVQLLLAFGLSFELPIAILLVTWSGFTSAEKLAKHRPYVIIIAFVIGMLLTPPDVISQILLAVPLWLLYELGLFLSRIFIKIDDEAQMESSP